MSSATDQSDRKMPKIWVLHNMPRSGGTLLSKCIGSMQGHVLLSEIHPDAQHALSFNALNQAQQWHDLLPGLNWQKTDFIESVMKIEKAVSNKNKRLILRDWSHVDYLGPPVTDQPKMMPGLLNTLSAHFEIVSIQLVRHPLDTWLSLRRLSLIKKHKIEWPQFLAAYRCYIDKTGCEHRIVYEDFLKTPEQSLQLACNKVGLLFDASFSDKWFNYKKITGDTSNSSSLRTKQKIEFRPRRQCADIDQASLDNNINYQFLVNEIYGSTVD